MVIPDRRTSAHFSEFPFPDSMILDLTDEQKVFQGDVARFATDRLAPQASAIDEEGAFPRDLVRELASFGLMGVTVGTEWGGAGKDYVSYALAVEALARASAVVAVIAAVNNSLVVEPIARFGSDSQKQLWLRRLASGQSLGAFALSEENAGSDAANQQTVARLDDRGYALNGRKVWVANAEAADLAIIFAATQPGLRGRGVSAFLVPMDSTGITRVPTDDSLGVRGLGCMDLELRDVRVDAECLLGRLAMDSGSPCGRSRAAGWRLPRRRSAWVRPLLTRRWHMPGRGQRSDSRSGTSRRFNG